MSAALPALTTDDIETIIDGIENFIMDGDPDVDAIWQPYIDKLRATGEGAPTKIGEQLGLSGHLLVVPNEHDSPGEGARDAQVESAEETHGQSAAEVARGPSAGLAQAPGDRADDGRNREVRETAPVAVSRLQGELLEALKSEGQKDVWIKMLSEALRNVAIGCCELPDDWEGSVADALDLIQQRLMRDDLELARLRGEAAVRPSGAQSNNSATPASDDGLLVNGASVSTNRVAPSGPDSERFATMLWCAHTSRSGGNDYHLCDNCNLMWDYRRETWQDALLNLMRKAAHGR